MKKSKFRNKVKVGIAGLLLGATLISGTACAQQQKDEEIIKNDNKAPIVTMQNETSKEILSREEALNARKDLTSMINNTFSKYITVEGQNVGESIILEDGTSVTKRVGCATAPNGDNVAWFGDEYYAIYTDGQAFLNDNEYPEETEQYISIKDALLDIVNDDNHKIVKLNETTYQIDDNDCNVYKILIEDGKIATIYDTYTEFSTGKTYTSNAFFNETDEQEFVERLNDAIEEIEDAQEYFNGLTK